MKKAIQDNLLHIIVALAYHLIFFLATMLWMKDECVSLLIAALIGGVLYLIYWIIAGRRSYMPWIVYVAFFVGTAGQLLLNIVGVVPEDGYDFFVGLGQLFYEFEIAGIAILIGIANLIMFGITRIRTSRQKFKNI